MFIIKLLVLKMLMLKKKQRIGIIYSKRKLNFLAGMTQDQQKAFLSLGSITRTSSRS